MEEHHLDILTAVILPYFNFAVFLAAAVFFFRKMVKVAAEKQRTDFQKLMTEAQAARDQAAARLGELKRRQAGLDKEIADIMSMSKASADLDAGKIAGDAERLANHLRDEAKRIAAAEIGAARATMRREIVDAVQDAVTKKLKAEMTPDLQLSLVKKKIGELKSIHVEG